MRTIKQALLYTALTATLASAAGLANAAPRSADPYTDGGRSIHEPRSPYTDGGFSATGKRDVYTDGAFSATGKRDVFTDGA